MRGVLRGWLELAKKVGFFLLLVAGSSVLGLAIAWPLWYFAISARKAYTLFVLCIAVAGTLALAGRAMLRARKAPRDPGKPRRPLLSLLLFLLQTLAFLVGLYAVVLFVFRGLWLFAIPMLVIWLALLVALGIGRRAVKAR